MEIFSNVNNSMFFSTSVWHPRHLVSSEKMVKIPHDRRNDDTIPSGEMSVLPEGLDYLVHLPDALQELFKAELCWSWPL